MSERDAQQIALISTGLRLKRLGKLPDRLPEIVYDDSTPATTTSQAVESAGEGASHGIAGGDQPAATPVLQPVGGVSSELGIAWKADTAFTSRKPSAYRVEARFPRFWASKFGGEPHTRRKSEELGKKPTEYSKRIRLGMSAPKSPHIQYQLDGEGAKRPSLVSHHSSGSREQLSSSAQKPRAHVVGKRNKSSGHLTRLNRAHSGKNLAAKGLKPMAGGKLNRTASHVKFRVEEDAAPAVDWEEEGDEEETEPATDSAEKAALKKDDDVAVEKAEEKAHSPQREAAQSTEVSRQVTPLPSEPEDSHIPEAMSSADQTAPGTPLEQSLISLPAAAPRNMTRTQWKNALERQHTMTFTEPRQRPSGLTQSLNHMGEPDPRIDPISGKVIVRVAVKEAKKDFEAARRVTGRNPIGEALSASTATGQYEPRPRSRSWINSAQSSTAPGNQTAKRGGLFAGTRRSEQKGKATLKPLTPAEMERKREFVAAMKGDLGNRLKDLWAHPATTD